MDFQSAARFGERRVMVTDYDETAVEVNAKVVDENTGEVICECESGGGGGECIKNAVVSVTSDSVTPLGLQSYLVDAATINPSLSGYIINNTLISIEAGQSKNILIPSDGLCYSLSNVFIEIIDGEATVAEVIVEGGATFKVLKINGNCTVKLSNPK